MGCDRLVFASHEQPNSGSTQEGHLLAETGVLGRYCSIAAAAAAVVAVVVAAAAVVVGVVVGHRSQTTTLTPLDQIATDPSTTDGC